MPKLDILFAPTSIAVIGASRTPGKVGYSILENLKTSFSGQLYPINPNTTELIGLATYPSVLNVENSIDLAVIAVPASEVLSVVSECIKKEIPAAIIISAGFSEIGENKREKELKKLSKDIKILGPNCMGIYTSELDMIFFPKNRLKRPKQGHISFISQSGGVGSVLLDKIAQNGIGISKFISIGNRIDIDEIELLEYLSKDLETRCIAIYLESTEKGKELIDKAKKIVKNKPIVILKAGKSEQGRQAVLSHIGKTTSPPEVYSAAFNQAGIIEVSSTEELFDAAKVLANQPILKNDKIAIVTNTGGFGVLTTDEVIKQGFQLSELPKPTQNTLKSILPKYAATKNPIDLTADSTVEMYEKILEIIFKDKNISAVVIIALVQTPALEETITNSIRDTKIYGKPVTVCMTGSDYTRSIARKIESFGIPVYPTPERAVRALTFLRQYAKIKKK